MLQSLNDIFTLHTTTWTADVHACLPIQLANTAALAMISNNTPLFWKTRSPVMHNDVEDHTQKRGRPGDVEVVKRYTRCVVCLYLK
jgi:hypothetical protein